MSGTTAEVTPPPVPRSRQRRSSGENCARLPTMSATEPGFTAVCTDALRREGVKGKRAAVTLRAGRLVIAGEEGGAIPIDLADIARLRIFHNEGRYTDYFHADILRTS